VITLISKYNYMENITSQQIKDAIVRAKTDPNYAQQLQQRLETGKFDTQLSEIGLKRSPSGLVKVTEVDVGTSPIGYKDTGSDIMQTGQGIANVAKETVGNIKESFAAQKAGEQTLGETIGQTVGQVAGGISGVGGEIVKGAVKVALPQEVEDATKQVLAKGIQVAGDLVGKYEQLKQNKPVLAGALSLALGKAPDAALTAKDMIDGYNKIKETNPRMARNLDAILGIGELALDVVTLGAGKVGVTAGKEALVTGGKAAGKQIAETGAKVGAKTAKLAKEGGEIIKNKTLDFVSAEVDDATKTILKETPVSKFDEAERIAREAASDPRKPSSFEVVGEKLADSAKQIDGQVKALQEQKKTILGKAKTGLVDFKKETGQVILDINRALKESKVAKSFISRLKKVQNKLDADAAIDELQDVLYKGNKDMTIPEGSAEDKVLRGILGKYNTELKKGLPKSYTTINAQMSERLKALNSLNSALGEAVEGVSTRGAGLIKQFFSPSGTKAKELIAYIKKTTGYDIAQDTVLAKYMAKQFGDIRARSLLEGIPTSTSGVVNKIIEFGVEKTGVGEGIRKAARQGSIRKARSLTKNPK